MMPSDFVLKKLALTAVSVFLGTIVKRLETQVENRRITDGEFIMELPSFELFSSFARKCSKWPTS
jgi:hypothetical protein